MVAIIGFIACSFLLCICYISIVNNSTFDVTKVRLSCEKNYANTLLYELANVRKEINEYPFNLINRLNYLLFYKTAARAFKQYIDSMSSTGDLLKLKVIFDKEPFRTLIEEKDSCFFEFKLLVDTRYSIISKGGVCPSISVF